MKIKSLLSSAFGKFHWEKPLLFEDGLNIISGDNEDGKTTLGLFILGMLYGFKREGRSRISRTPEYEKCRPWNGKEYKGILTYEDGGRVYRIERWFDPDVTKVYNEETGEDITREFTQDARKELDFAQRHLGLTSKEFKNTIWVGQLGSPQEQGLGVEIQGKIESILQGTNQDLSLARALAVLSEEKNAIKPQRSGKGRLDAVQKSIAQMETEIHLAKEREAQIRIWMAELNKLNGEKVSCEEEMGKAKEEYTLVRYFYLKNIIAKANEIQSNLLSLEKKIQESSWASEIPADCQERLATVVSNMDRLSAQINAVKSELNKVLSEKEICDKSILDLDHIKSLGLTQSGFSSLRTKYLSFKANAARGERLANEARKELAKVEEEGKAKGLKEKNLSEDVLGKAQDYQEIVTLAERTLDKLSLEAEKERGQVGTINPGGAAGWIYALALGILSIAVVLTVMGVPLASWVSFGVAVFVFAIGALRHRSLYQTRKEQELKLAQAEAQLEEQKKRVQDGKKVLTEFLLAAGVKSIDELRSAFREVKDYQERYERAKEKYDMAHNYWFEAASEFSSVEKELIGVMKSSGLVQGVSLEDQALDRLSQKLESLSKIEQDKLGLEKREKDMQNTLERLEQQKSRLQMALHEILSLAQVLSEEELACKITANKEYVDALEEKSMDEKRLNEILSGRSLEDLSREMSDLSFHINADEKVVAERTYSAKDLDEITDRLETLKAKKQKIQLDVSGLERAIGLRSQEGRPSTEIQEELFLERQKEQELMVQKDALELALSVLEDLSKNIRREFAPALNMRTGKILDSITGGRYGQVRISPDLEISVIHPDSQSATSVSNLSGGTIDQCYFALRVAVAEVITKKEEFPFFLDDPFVQYDLRRLEGAMRILSELSKKHQILLFSCHRREEEASQRLGIGFNLVDLSLQK